MSEIHAITRFLFARYRDGARGEGGEYDCWGMTREARSVLYGRPMLPSFGGEYRRDAAGFTGHYEAQARHMQEINTPQAGCIAAVLRGRLCLHVALVVHDIGRTGMGLHVLEINPEVGARIVPLSRFASEHKHPRIIKYYDDQNLPLTP